MNLYKNDYNVPTATPSSPKVTDTLGTVFFQPGRTTESLRLLMAGLPDAATRLTSTYSAIGTESYDLFIWAGAIPAGKKAKKIPVGEYVCWNPYLGAAVQRAHQKTSGSVLKNRFGLSANDIAAYVVCSAEIDDQDITTQAQRLDALESETGIAFTVVALSGDTRPESIAAAGVDSGRVQPGKSIHVFLAVNATTLAKWKRIQELLCLTLGGDTSLSNPDRLMRLPGAIGHEADHRGTGRGQKRIQTVLRTAPTLYEADALIATLEAVVTARGLTLPAPLAASKARTSKAGVNHSNTNWVEQDFTAVMVEGTELNLLDWTYQNLAPGTELSIGFPFTTRAKGDGILDGSSCILHHSHGGKVWLHSFKTGQSYHHEDVSLPSGVTPVGSTPDEMGEVTTPAPSATPRTAHQEETYREAQAAHAAGAKREKDIAALKAANPAFQAKLDKVARAAEELNPNIRDANIGVMTYAKSTLLPKFRAHWASKGITRANSKPCGCRTAAQNVVAHELVMYRRTCGALPCPNCGPLAMSRKMAAILKAPLTNNKGEIIGCSLGGRPHTYLHTVPNEELPALIHMMQRAATVDTSATPGGSKTEIAARLGVTTRSLHNYVTGARKWPVGMQEIYESITNPTVETDASYGDHTYVTFRPSGEATTTVLTTHNLLDVKHPVELVEQPNLEAKVWDLFTSTYDITTSITMMDLTTGEEETTPVDPTVLGEVTSAHNLTLAPEAIAKIASGACFVQVIPVAKDIEEAREVLDLILPPGSVRVDPDGQTLTASVTDITTLEAIQAQLSKEPQPAPYTPEERALVDHHHANLLAQRVVDFDAMFDAMLAA